MHGGQPTLVLPSGISRYTVVVITDAVAERARQITAGNTEAHDDNNHIDRSLAKVGATYAAMASMSDELREHHEQALRKGLFYGFRSIVADLWPRTWALCLFKPKGRRSDIISAIAFLIAEAERLDRDAERAHAKAAGR